MAVYDFEELFQVVQPETRMTLTGAYTSAKAADPAKLLLLTLTLTLMVDNGNPIPNANPNLIPNPNYMPLRYVNYKCIQGQI